MTIDLVEAGYVIKTHGVKGFLRIAFNENVKELTVSKALFLPVRGDKMPFFIKEIDYIDNGDAFVLLEDIHSKEEAERLTKKYVWVTPDFIILDDENEEEISYESYLIVDNKIGEIGRVTGIYQQQEYDLAEVNYQGKEVMIPLHNDTIISIDDESKIIKMDLPEGLLEL